MPDRCAAPAREDLLAGSQRRNDKRSATPSSLGMKMTASASLDRKELLREISERGALAATLTRSRARPAVGTSHLSPRRSDLQRNRLRKCSLK